MKEGMLYGSKCKQRFVHDVGVLVSSAGLPLVLSEFLQKTLRDDLTLSVVCFPSSREAASNFS